MSVSITPIKETSLCDRCRPSKKSKQIKMRFWFMHGHLCVSYINVMIYALSLSLSKLQKTDCQ